MKYILKSKITGFVGDIACSQRYRAVLEHGVKNQIVIEEEINDNWYVCARWDLSHLTPDWNRIYIDYGQKWLATGIGDARKEAIEWLESETTVS